MNRTYLGAAKCGIEELRVLGEHALDLPGGDVLAPPSDRVRARLDEPVEAIGVPARPVARVEAEVPQRGKRRRVVVPIPLHHHGRISV
jgi:hypothetical protein